jgi:hypothetical protein
LSKCGHVQPERSRRGGRWVDRRPCQQSESTLALAVALAVPFRAFAATHAQEIDALIRSYVELRQFTRETIAIAIGPQM